MSLNRGRAVCLILGSGLPLLLGACASTPTPPLNTTVRVAACGTDALTITRLGGDAGMGHRTLAFAFTNTSATSCRLGGYAVVTPLDSDGQPVNAINLTRATGDYLNPQRQVRSIDLLPGKRAWFEIGYSVIPHGNAACPSVQQIQVRPPGADRGTTFTQPMSPCDGIEVLPLQDGPAPY